MVRSSGPGDWTVARRRERSATECTVAARDISGVSRLPRHRAHRARGSQLRPDPPHPDGRIVTVPPRPRDGYRLDTRALHGSKVHESCDLYAALTTGANVPSPASTPAFVGTPFGSGRLRAAVACGAISEGGGSVVYLRGSRTAQPPSRPAAPQTFKDVSRLQSCSVIVRSPLRSKAHSRQRGARVRGRRGARGRAPPVRAYTPSPRHATCAAGTHSCLSCRIPPGGEVAGPWCRHYESS